MSLSKLLEFYPYSASALSETRFEFPSVDGTLSDNWTSELTEDQFFKESMRKNPFLPKENDLNVKTMELFFEMEQRCLTYNSRFNELFANTKLVEILTTWRTHVRTIMGDCYATYGKINSGATVSVATGNSPLERFAEPTMTHELFAFKTQHGPYNWDMMPYNASDIVFHSGSVTKTVPKSAKINRVINPEPSCNSFEQAAYGATMQRRLLHVGIDLSTAQEVHRKLAHEASISGLYATKDLTSASALIYTELCKWLLSHEWYSALNACRSHHTWVDRSPIYDFGHYWKLQQFATMGNGFCFELETIIFLGLMRAVAEVSGQEFLTYSCYCYGDDMIVPTSLSKNLSSVIKAVGFLENREKSFDSGPFRESCGGDFLAGHDVRPVYFKLAASNHYELTVMANQVWDKYHTRFSELPRIALIWAQIVDLIPKDARLWGPSRLGDIVLHGPFEPAVKTNKYKGDSFRCWAAEPVTLTSIGHIIHKGVHPSTFAKLACGGYLRGRGIVPVTRADGTIEHRYQQFAAPGTKFRHVKKWVRYYQYPSMIDEQDPLSIFQHLPNADRRIVARTQRDYVQLTTDKKRSLIRTFAAKLQHLVDKQGDFSPLGVDLGLDEFSFD